MKYIIDYPCGGMGNSVLAHVLYSCNQVDFDVDNFFSDTGDSHKISEFNRSNLIACHENQQGLYPDPKIVIISIVCRGYYEILRKKLAYAKWKGYYPTPINYIEEFKFGSPVSGQSDLENLTTKYYDSFDRNTTAISESRSILLLEDYINGNIKSLESIVTKKFGWAWNRNKSFVFHSKLLEKNKLYFDWLHKIQNIVESCKQNQDIDVELVFWEKAIVIAKICYDLGIHPIDLHWTNFDCFLEKNNVSLVNSIKRLKHGKTI